MSGRESTTTQETTEREAVAIETTAREEREAEVERVSARVHDAWMAAKRAQGVTSRKSETGEELMVPYAQLSEAAKDLDRGSVRAVLAAMEPTPAPSAGRTEGEGVEEIARALCDEWGYQWQPCADGCDHTCDCLGRSDEGQDCERPSRSDFRRAARRVIAALASPRPSAPAPERAE